MLICRNFASSKDIGIILRLTSEKIMNEKVGTIAGQIWNALNENGALNTKDLKKAAKVKTDKEIFLGLGWLLREDKVTLTEAEKDIVVALN